MSLLAKAVLVAALSAAFPVLAWADQIELKLPKYPDGSHEFHHELISEALKAAGHTVKITAAGPMPQSRANAEFDKGEISALWFVQNKERDEKYTPVKVGLTNGLIGNRILFIPKGKQAEYDKVKTLEDFQKLGKVGGFGKGWFDVAVWKANNLKYTEEDGEWRALYGKIAKGGRGVDYFSRGAHEILGEAPSHTDLDIEKNLVLVYERDFQYYLSKPYAKHKDAFEAALKKAKESGLIEKMLQKHFKQVYDELRLNARTKIVLATPK